MNKHVGTLIFLKMFLKRPINLFAHFERFGNNSVRICYEYNHLTQMKEDTYKHNLIQTLIYRSRLSWYWFAAILICILLSFLVLAAFLDGFLPRLSHLEFWREFIGAPVLIAYILVAYPYMFRLWENAIRAYHTILSSGNTKSDTIGLPVPNRKAEWSSILIGAVFWIVLQGIWNWQWGVEGWWLYLYTLVSFSLLFGLLGWLIYNSVADSQYLNKLSRQNLKLDIFDTSVLTPVARSSLAVSLAFIGGISLSLIFQTFESLIAWTSITIYVILVLATVLIFFFSMWSTHRVMAGAKNNELSVVRKHLEEATRKLRDTVRDNAEGIETIYAAVAAWGTYERRVREVREWPFNATILRRLLASTFVPAAVYLIKVLIGVRIGGL